MSAKYEIAVVTVELTPGKLEELKSKFKKVHYFPGGSPVPDEVLPEADIWYTNWIGLPAKVTSVSQIPRTKIVQLSSAGANKFLASELMQTDEAKKQISVCSSSGIHTCSIPQYVIANIVNLYMRLQLQFHLARTTSKWPEVAEIRRLAGGAGERHPGNRCLYGKTVGMLGYGHIARETARLLKAFHCTIIAANSKGDKRPEEGYTIPGTGDEDGSIPEEYYATTDPESFKKFLSKCDVLVASLPSTPQTQYMLTEEHFDALPADAIFVNIGRGDLVKSEVILEALDKPDGLGGAALDVTDPEPLTEGHALFSHPNAIVTAHTSGSFENYYDAGADVLIAQMERLQTGKPPFNVVDPAKGY